MKALRVAEVRALVQSDPFKAWYERYRDLHDGAKGARKRHDEILAELAMLQFTAESSQVRADDTLFRAGECEDLSSNAAAAFAEIENDSDGELRLCTRASSFH